MILALCLAIFLAVLVVGRWSLVDGVGMVLGVGYIYGLARANVLDMASYFLFDAAVLGLYLAAAREVFRPRAQLRYASLRIWLGLLIGWPLLLLVVPVQDVLIQLVGLRCNVFLVPLILIGALLDSSRIGRLATWLAVLNLAALILACVEFRIGIEPLFPRSPITEIMYRSKDVAGATAYRIPSSFSSAHAYGGTMARTLPWLLASWLQPGRSFWNKTLLATGAAAAILGVLLSSTRVPAAVMIGTLAVFSLSPEVTSRFRLTWLTVLGVIGYYASSEERLQRFTKLADMETVADRVGGSIHMGFFDLVADYPLGAGLGGGSSIPSFLRDRLAGPVIGLENELARIQLDTGLPGVLLWLAFLIWLLGRIAARAEWLRSLTARLLAVSLLGDLLISLIGTGTLTAIPATVLLMLSIGYLGRDTIALPPIDHRASDPSLSARLRTTANVH